MTGKEPTESEKKPVEGSDLPRATKRLGKNAVGGTGRIDYFDFGAPLNPGPEISTRPSESVSLLLDYAKDALRLGTHELELMEDLYVSDEAWQKINQLASYAEKKDKFSPKDMWLIDQAERGDLSPFEMLEVHSIGLPNVTVAQYNYLPGLNEDMMREKRAEIVKDAFLHGATSVDMDNFEIGFTRFKHSNKDDFAINDSATFKMKRVIAELPTGGVLCERTVGLFRTGFSESEETHELVRQAVNGMLDDEGRSTLHGNVAEMFNGESSDNFVICRTVIYTRSAIPAKEQEFDSDGVEIVDMREYAPGALRKSSGVKTDWED